MLVGAQPATSTRDGSLARRRRSRDRRRRHAGRRLRQRRGEGRGTWSSWQSNPGSAADGRTARRDRACVFDKTGGPPRGFSLYHFRDARPRWRDRCGEAPHRLPIY
jgi:hypothetical protein